MVRNRKSKLAKILALANQRDLEVADTFDLDDASRTLLADLKQLETSVKSICEAPVEVAPFDVERLLRRLAKAKVNKTATQPWKAERGDSLKSRLSDEAAVPKQLGEYDVWETLGRGSTGTVYLAHHRMLKRKVAIKLLRENADEVTTARFAREMEVVAGLSSPHIVAATDARIVGEHQFLVMEYVRGTTFTKLAESKGPLPISTACELIRQTCIGLGAAHGVSIVHRDIKPSNLMLNESAVVKILDLGLASIRFAYEQDGDKPPSLTPASNIMGTIDYIAPEQIEDPRRADVRSDIYSLGCVFYLLLTGAPPFSSEEFPADVARLMAHLSVEPKLVSERRTDGANQADMIAAKMLAKLPQDRFQSASQVAEALAPLCREATNH